MRKITAMDINNLVIKTLSAIEKNGITSNSRCGNVKGLFDCELILTNPQNRHISLSARKYNIYASIAELIWVFSGDEDIDPLLSYFLKRAKDFSDDGKKWRGAYGPRLYNGRQISNIIHSFTNEGITTRRATFAIWTPYEDTIFSIEEAEYGLKDIPCTLGGTFWISSNKLFLKLFMRSNDVIWGLSHINILEWTFFQELICYLLNNLMDKDISLGYYHHSVTNLHCYERYLGRSDSILKSNKNLAEYNKQTSFSLKIPYQKGNIDGSIKSFFSALSDEIVLNINNRFSLNERLNRINGIFDETYKIEKERNLIYSYMIVIVLFIHFDNLNNENESDSAKTILNFVPEDLKRSMLYSIKTPHEINKILKEEII
jgi:thymidylate synthase